MKDHSDLMDDAALDASLSYLGQRWHERPLRGDPRLLAEGGCDPRIARLLARRGFSAPEEVAAFLDAGLHRLHPPRSLKGVETAALRIREAVARGETIGVYGDYDVDGQTSTALLALVLGRLGARVVTYIPHRTKEGYGVNRRALEWLKEQGCTLVVTVDCGITSVDEARWAAQNGLDLIITDHHQPQEALPDALAIVNPHLDPAYPFPHLAGCGVAFKLAEAVSEEFTGGRELAHEYVELAALGTVADVVPLLGENRALVKAGLERINGKGAIPGIQALRAVAGVHGPVTAGHIAFVLAPRLNAVGRVADARIGLKLLLAPTYDDALPYARKLEEENALRRRLEEEVLEQAHGAVRRRHDPDADFGLVVDGPGWHPGVIGIVASRLVEAYYRPTVVLSVDGDEARGSARSIPGFDLFAALSECADLFTAFGGHEAAAGLSLPVSRIEEFRERFRSVTKARLTADDLIPVLVYDGDVGAGDLDLEFIEALEKLEPFGVGNPAPVLVLRDCRVEAGAVGKDKAHLKLAVSDAARGRTLEGIGFHLASQVLPHLSRRALVDIAFVPAVNEWNGERRPELRIRDVRKATTLASPAARALWTLEEEIAAAGESLALSTAVAGRTAGSGAPPALDEVRRTLREREVVDARGAALGPLVEELLAGGHSVLAFPAGPGLSLDLARRLAEHSPRVRERTFLWSVALSPSLRELVCAAAEAPPWVAVVGSWEELEPGGHAFWHSVVERARPVILLCHVPAAPRTGLIGLYRLARLAPRAPLYLAWSGEEGRALSEALKRIYPDREALSRVYVALREVARGSGRAEPGAVLERLGARWPRLELGDALAEAVAIFEETGLVQAAGGGWTLVETRSKVDLTRSLRYNESIAIREHYLAFVEEMASLPPERAVDRLIERGAPWWPQPTSKR